MSEAAITNLCATVLDLHRATRNQAVAGTIQHRIVALLRARESLDYEVLGNGALPGFGTGTKGKLHGEDDLLALLKPMPSTFLIDFTQKAVEQPTGIKSLEDIEQAINAILGAALGRNPFSAPPPPSKP